MSEKSVKKQKAEKVNIKSLEQPRVRREIIITTNDNKKEKVTIYNPVGVKREQLINLISRKDLTDDEMAREILLIVTDLNIHKRVHLEKIFINPTMEFRTIMHEVFAIRHEIEMALVYDGLRHIDKVEFELMNIKLIEKSTDVLSLSKELNAPNLPVDIVEGQLRDYLGDDFVDDIIEEHLDTDLGLEKEVGEENGENLS